MTDTESDRSAMLAEIIPPKLLPRLLQRFDLVTLYFALIFGSYGAAQMAAGGWAAIPMMILAAITFLAPCALAAYELGTLYPGEGGVYVWAHKTAGPIHGFIAGWLSWVPIFLLLPLGAITVVAHAQYLFDSEWSLSTQVFVQACFIAAVTGVSATRLRISQGYIRIMFFVSLATALAVFAVGLTTAQPATPVNSDIYAFDLNVHGALYSAAVLWLLGVEVPFNMGAEIRDHKRAVGTMFLWGTIALLIAYLIGIAGILLTTSQGEIDVTTGLARAAGSQWATAGVIVGCAVMLAVSSQDVAYMNTYSRLLFISGIERRLPAVFGQITSTTRVPLPALLAQGVGAIGVVLIFSSQPNLAVAFNFYIAALIVVWCCALFYLYFGIVRARFALQHDYVERGDEVWRIPGGKAGVIFVALFGSAFNAVAIYYVFALPMSADVSPDQWRQWLAVLAGLVLLTGIAIFALGRKNAKEATVESELAKYAMFDEAPE
ncbi:MAG TPA: APC family permease [Allosphingosinicella sp.]|nr:APC family permease [Allosphingosinicella sp.]